MPTRRRLPTRVAVVVGGLALLVLGYATWAVVLAVAADDLAREMGVSSPSGSGWAWNDPHPVRSTSAVRGDRLLLVLAYDQGT